MKKAGLILLVIHSLSSAGLAQDTLDFGVVNELSIAKQIVQNAYLQNDSVYQVTVFSLGRFSHFQADKDSVVKVDTNKSKVEISLDSDHNVDHYGLLFYEKKHTLLSTTNGTTEYPYGLKVLKASGEYSNNYYSSTRNLTGEDLKAELKSVTGNGYVNLGYTAARDNMYATIDNTNGDVECVYTGTVAQFSDRQGANNAGFNCEHTFPQGFFSQQEPMRADIHHLFPTTVSSNSRRGNDPFGVVSNPSWQQGGSKSGGGTFEPRDDHKGTVARAMMYFVLRYQDYSNFLSGQENILRQWHQSFPPSSADRSRNEEIFKVQKNRNPLVDYPQFADRIKSISGNGDLDNYRSLAFSKTFDNPVFYDSAYTAGYQIFSGIIYNDGNSASTIEYIGPKDTTQTGHGKFGSLGTNIIKNKTLAPGEYYYYEVTWPWVDGGWTHIDDTLIIRTNADNQPYREVPFDCWFWTGSGLAEHSSLKEYKLYPNPASDRINVDFEGVSSVEFFILDIHGRAIRSGKISNGVINLQGIPDGNYLITFYENHQLSGRNNLIITH
jgi:hypothetical protein